MRSLFAALAFISLLRVSTGHPSDREIEHFGEVSQHISEKDAFPFTILQPSWQVTLVKTEEYAKLDFSSLSVLAQRVSTYSAQYFDLFRCQSSERFPIQLILLFPFHEFD